MNALFQACEQYDTVEALDDKTLCVFEKEEEQAC